MCACQLILTVGLLAVVVYLYTVVAFNFFRKFYNKSDDKDIQDMKCNDMLTVSLMCILTHTLPPHICLLSPSLSFCAYLCNANTATHLLFYLHSERGRGRLWQGSPLFKWKQPHVLFHQLFFFYKMMDTLRENSPRSLSTALCLATQNINTPLPALF